MWYHNDCIFEGTVLILPTGKQSTSLWEMRNIYIVGIKFKWGTTMVGNPNAHHRLECWVGRYHHGTSFYMGHHHVTVWERISPPGNARPWPPRFSDVVSCEFYLVVRILTPLLLSRFTIVVVHLSHSFPSKKLLWLRRYYARSIDEPKTKIAHGCTLGCGIKWVPLFVDWKHSAGRNCQAKRHSRDRVIRWCVAGSIEVYELVDRMV